MGNIPRCLISVRVMTGITLIVMLVAVSSYGVDGQQVISKRENKSRPLERKEENEVLSVHGGLVPHTSPNVPVCASHDSSDCVVNANNAYNCTCNIDLTYENFIATENMNITLEVDANATKPSERVVPHRVLDKMTIELHIQEDEANVYNIFCSTENGFHLVGSATFTVNVGSDPPMDVIDYHCVSYNWEELICRWKKPFNPAQGNDNDNTIQPYLYDDRTECGVGRGCLYNGVTGALKDCCYWNTTTGYLPDTPSLAMVFLITNALQTQSVQFRKPIDYVGVVLPNPAKNFTATPEDSTTVNLTWSTPDALVSFPADVIYRIRYKLNSTNDTNFPWYPPITGNCSLNNCQKRMNVDYPGMKYQAEVKLRSGAANFTLEDDDWWSNSSTQDFTTPPESPWSAPGVTSGSYQVQMTSSVSEVYDLIFEWQQLNFTQFNGPDFHYVITATSHGNLTVTKIADYRESYVMFKNMSKNVDYKLEVRGANIVGESNVSSVLYIPPVSTMPEMPVLPAVIYYTDKEVYNLTWQGSDKLAYTIYLCFDDANTPDPCKRMLYWKHVGYKTSVNVTLDEFNVTEPLDSSPRFAVSAEDEDERSSGMNWDCCVHPQPYGITSDVQPTIKETTDVTASKVMIRWSVSCRGWGSVIESVRVEYCPGQFDFVDNCTDTLQSKIGPIVTSATDCLNNVPLSGLKTNTTYSLWITLLVQGNKSSLRSHSSQVITSPIVVIGLEAWEIILIVIGSLAAVALILVIILIVQRKWKEIKKQLNQEPNVPVGLSSDVGSLPGDEVKKMDSERDQNPQGRGNQRSAVFTENEVQREPVSLISNLFSETVRDCFKSSPPTPDEEALLSSRGHLNKGYEDTSLRRFHEPNSASSSGTSEENSDMSHCLEGSDTHGSHPGSIKSYATTQGYVAPDIGGLIPTPRSENIEIADALTHESSSPDTMDYENAKGDCLNHEGNQIFNSGYVSSDIINIDPVGRSRYVSVQDANNIVTHPKTNEYTTKPGYVSVENTQSMIPAPTSTLAPGYVAISDVHIDPKCEDLEETKPFTEKPKSGSLSAYVTADEMSSRIPSKSGYVLAEAANSLSTVPSSFSTHVYGTQADESLEAKFSTGNGKMEDANKLVEEAGPAMNTGNMASDDINTEDLGQLVATTPEIQTISEETSKLNPGSGYVRLDDANMIVGQTESAQTTSNVIPEDENLKDKLQTGYVSVEEANKFAKTLKPSSTLEHNVSPKETIKSTSNPAYTSADDVEKLMKTRLSISNPGFAGLEDVPLQTESKPGYVSVKDAEKFTTISPLSTSNPILKETASEETVFQDKLPYGYSRVGGL